MDKRILFTGMFILIIVLTSGCDVFNQAVQNAIEQTQTASAKNGYSSVSSTSSGNSNSTPGYSSSNTWSLTSTKTSAPNNVSYMRAKDVTSNFVGQSIEICGKVTNYGKENCPECIYGYFSYLILDDYFYIISYDWTFNSKWIGSHFIAKDKVEMMGSKTIFVFGGREGWDGSNCEIMPDGTRFCDGGDYFNFVSTCGSPKQ